MAKAISLGTSTTALPPLGRQALRQRYVLDFLPALDGGKRLFVTCELQADVAGRFRDVLYPK
jgi:hypothetical protein